TSPASGTYLLPPGAIRAENNRLLAGCGQTGTLSIDKLQMAGKPARTAAEFLCGHKIHPDDTFKNR
ncbi:MAG: hypothetical protein DRH03_02270, partial [Deltaproteobacteria bacterium]